MSMKKIKNMQQLQLKKKEIELQQQALLQKIHSNWLQLKENIKPVNIAKESLVNILQHQPTELHNGEHALQHSYTYAVGLLAEKLADKAFEKVKSIFKK
jgi:hypothetical protein